jgi:hypothetical protein
MRVKPYVALRACVAGELAAAARCLLVFRPGGPAYRGVMDAAPGPAEWLAW